MKVSCINEKIILNSKNGSNITNDRLTGINIDTRNVSSKKLKKQYYGM